MTKLDAVIMAGAPNKGRLREISGEPYEALIEIAGKPMVRHAVEAVVRAGRIDRVVVVGPEPELREALAGLNVVIISAREGMLENALHGCAHLAEIRGGPRGLVFVSASDCPLVTPEIIDEFIGTCLDLGGEVFYPVLERSVVEARFPTTKRTYAKLRDGTYTGANMAVVDSAVLHREAETARALIRARKNPVKMARTLGVGFIFKLLFGRLTVAALEAHVGRTFGFTARAVIAPWVEIGIDVDKPEDLELVREYLTRDRAGSGVALSG